MRVALAVWVATSRSAVAVSDICSKLKQELYVEGFGKVALVVVWVPKKCSCGSVMAVGRTGQPRHAKNAVPRHRSWTFQS